LTEDRRKILDRVKDIWLYVLPRVCEVSRLRVKKREWQYHLSHETGCMESIRPGEEKQKRPDLARRRCGSLRGDVRQPRSHRSTTARRPIHRRRMCAVTLLGKSEDENVDENGATESRHPLGQSLVRKLHMITAHECSGFCEHQEPRGVLPHYLASTRPAQDIQKLSHYPRTHQGNGGLNRLILYRK